MKKVLLSVTEFALPAPLRGSIEAHSGFGRASELGLEIHRQVQEKRAKESTGYTAEVAIRETFEREGFQFEVHGRIDGLFPGGKIEEIKTSFNTKELSRRLADDPYFHPYCLQLLTYGYFYSRQHEKIPELSFHLVSTRNFETLDLPLKLEIPIYEAWLERRLAVLGEEARAAEARASRRRKAGTKLKFPFPKPRAGQTELIATVEANAVKRLMIQAPTGLGKTVGVLYPSLKNALTRGQRVVYVTPKNSQHLLAEEAVTKLEEQGAKIRSLTITAKSKICFQNEPICNPEACEFAKDHYTKLAEHKVIEQLAKKKKLTAKVFRKVAAAHEVCPFEIQLDAALDADTVICDYNYVFAPRSAFGRVASTGLDQEGKPNLVIDEAHNLPARAMDYYSPELSTQQLERMRDDLQEIPKRFRADALDLLDRSVELIRESRPDKCTQPMRIDPPAAPFLEQEENLRAFLSRYLESDTEIEAGDPVLKFCFYWSAFTEALEHVTEEKPEFFTTYQPYLGGGTIKITCCDASTMLRDAFTNYEQVVAFSATLKPFEYYSRLSGLDGPELVTAEFSSPFPKENRKLLIIPQISSKYSEREKNFPKIAETIARLSAARPGNYVAFFPSFDFLEKVLARFSPPPEFLVAKQERQMRPEAVEALLQHLKSASRPTVLFAVQGGILSEGVDYPGDMLVGAFVVGPPLPVFDLEREGMRAYYEKNFAAGFDYAYTYPAMAKAVQSAGRVIRSETDRGLIVLMDDRFLQPSYQKSMPQGWFEQNPRELVSTSLLRDVADFWKKNSSSA